MDPATRSYNPISNKALRAASVFPSASMRTRAVAGREIVRSVQGGGKKTSSSADIITSYDVGRTFIVGRNNL